VHHCIAATVTASIYLVTNYSVQLLTLYSTHTITAVIAADYFVSLNNLQVVALVEKLLGAGVVTPDGLLRWGKALRHKAAITTAPPAAAAGAPPQYKNDAVESASALKALQPVFLRILGSGWEDKE
jgi:hypothetical protein